MKCPINASKIGAFGKLHSKSYIKFKPSEEKTDFIRFLLGDGEKD